MKVCHVAAEVGLRATHTNTKSNTKTPSGCLFVLFFVDWSISSNKMQLLHSLLQAEECGAKRYCLCLSCQHPRPTHTLATFSPPTTRAAPPSVMASCRTPSTTTLIFPADAVRLDDCELLHSLPTGIMSYRSVGERPASRYQHWSRTPLNRRRRRYLI